MHKREEYHPSPEEMNQAEEQLTAGRKGLSRSREAYFSKLKEHGLLGELMISHNFNEDGNPWDRLHGTIKGHRLDLQAGNDDQGHQRFYGIVDGISVSGETAARLFKKYQEFSYDIKEQEIGEDVARQEVQKEKLDAALRELLEAER